MGARKTLLMAAKKRLLLPVNATIDIVKLNRKAQTA
jgi:hypothetical protein